MRWPTLKGPIVIRIKTVSFIPLAILFAKVLEIAFQIYGREFTTQSIAGGGSFVSNFIEWFGVVYGLLLPLILVRVWEQLHQIDREFDREADAVKLLFEDIFYLQGKSADLGRQIVHSLREYVVHIINNYRDEIKQDNNIRLIHIIQKYLNKIIKIDNEIEASDERRTAGDAILNNIRRQCKTIILSTETATKGPNPFAAEIFKRLYDIMDIRGDRIGFASQRLFQSLRIVALITSITFLLPFYFVGFTPDTPPLDNILIVCVTVLVIFIYLIIEDFDEPFGGTWRINDDSWRRLLDEMDSEERKRELDDLSKRKPQKRVSTKLRENDKVRRGTGNRKAKTKS